MVQAGVRNYILDQKGNALEKTALTCRFGFYSGIVEINTCQCVNDRFHLFDTTDRSFYNSPGPWAASTEGVTAPAATSSAASPAVCKAFLLAGASMMLAPADTARAARLRNRSSTTNTAGTR